ncbi:calpain [Trypanosoma brucei equiperdum]|uniref:Calpain n=1 Tax=Trypanosoma brucei equiperdum TaxID=630700 RepID=A0A3L6KVA3_9TRYP|nr:calpain [Trypanosoma brucei equiperdum]
MNEHSHELAKLKASDSRTFLDPMPEGVPLSELELDKDEKFSTMEEERRKLIAEDREGNAARIAELEAAMNEHSHELAKLKASDSRSFLDPMPEGVPLSELGLDKDEKFSTMEEERRKLIAEDREGNAARIAELEAAMNEHSHELAKLKASDSRSFLDPMPEGVPLSELGLDKDEKFSTMEEERRKLIAEDREGNAARIAELEAAMNEHSHELAKLKASDSRSFLDPMPEGVPLSELGLDKDEKFSTMEEERRKLIAEDREGNAARIARLEERMNELSSELARMKLKDRSFLDPMPEGVPLSELGLDKDEKFSTMEEERRKLIAEDREGNAARIAELEAAMNEHSHELAKLKASDSRSFLDPMPEGVPLSELGLDKDEKFSTMEEERRKLIAEDREGNAARIAELEAAMNEHSHELAKLKASDSRSFLDPMPEGVPLSELGLDKDEKFSTMEEERRKLIAEDREGNATRIAELEVAMNEHSHELAKLKASDSRSFLDPMPEGVPLSELELDKDEKFSTMEEERRKLIAEDREGNATRIAELEVAMNEHSHELAKLKASYSRSFLDPMPEGVPLSELELDKDEKFSTMEEERRKLIAEDREGNATRIAELEVAMNEHSHELAKLKASDSRSFLDPMPEGVPLSELGLDKDEKFSTMEEERRKLIAEDREGNATRIAELEVAMNEHSHELAKLKASDSRSFLDPMPEGVPLSELELDKDEKFSTMEEERRKLIAEDREGNAARIAELEVAMNEHSHELAKLKASDSRSFLDPMPEGVPLSELELDKDEKFSTMEEERRKLIAEDREGNATRIAELEVAMNEHSHELAKLKASDSRSFLDPMPEGVPLSELELDKDEKFSTMEEERRKLIAEDREGNAARIAELEAAMNEHSHELAKLKASDSRSFLDPMPEGVPLSELELDKDEKFSTMEEERRKLIAEDREGNATRIGRLERKMGRRVDKLAKLKASYSRSFLDPMPEGVPLSELGLDKDEKFSTMEEERRKLIAEDREGNATRIAELEVAMNEHSHELAKLKASDSRSFLDPMPEGVPLSELELDKDEKFSTMEEERRKLIAEDREGNATRIAELEVAMNEHSHELAKLKASDSRSFLDPMPEGVPLSELELDKDEKFSTMEEERRKLIAEDREGNATRIAELEVAMNEHSHELAKLKASYSRSFLDPMPEGVPLSELELDKDEKFSTMEEERRKLIAEDREGNAARIAELEVAMNEHSHELAKLKASYSRSFLDPMPEGVPLSELELDKDEKFSTMEEERRKLIAEDREGNATRIGRLEKKRRRVDKLAKLKASYSRSFLDPMPEGVPLSELELDKDEKFSTMEEERRKLIAEDREGNAARIAELEVAMNEHSHELAKLKASDSRSFLDPMPEGVPLSELELDKDEKFSTMEEERRKLIAEDREGNATRIAELEAAMNEHSHELAKLKASDSRSFLDPMPEGVPLSELELHKDEKFSTMEEERRKLIAEDREGNAARIAELEVAMNEHSHELAKLKASYSRSFLDPMPEGVPLSELELDKDEKFSTMEEERRKLIAEDREGNATRIGRLERKWGGVLISWLN